MHFHSCTETNHGEFLLDIGLDFLHWQSCFFDSIVDDRVNGRFDGFRYVELVRPTQSSLSDCGDNERAVEHLVDIRCHLDNNPESKRVTKCPRKY